MTVDHDPFMLLPWQQGLWERLMQRRAEGTYPHALLLCGPVGVGKRQFAERLAAALVCEAPQLDKQPCGQCHACNLSIAGTHPDIHWLEPEEPGKAIKIDAVRDLIARSTLTTQARGSRVFVLSPADSLNRASANALLKTLEEPVSSTSLVLVSSHPHLLPATIRSRCQELTFKPVEPEAALEWLSSCEGEADPPALLALTGGAPLRAREAAAEGALAAAEKTVSQLIALKARQVNPMQVVEEWQSRQLLVVLEDISRACFDSIRLATTAKPQRLFMPASRENLQTLAEGIHLQGLFGFIDEINRLRRQMTHNLNSQMLLEKLVNDWLTLTRASRGGGAH